MVIKACQVSLGDQLDQVLVVRLVAEVSTLEDNDFQFGMRFRQSAKLAGLPYFRVDEGVEQAPLTVAVPKNMY